MIIETKHLDYSFDGHNNVLNKVNLKVPKASIYGFLGPNGAGKTTTLRLLLGLLKSDGTDIRLFSEPLQGYDQSRQYRIGSLIEMPSLYLHLSGKENLEICRLPYGLPKKRIDEVLHIVGLSDAARKKTKAYSLGMKQRLGIAIALLHDPELLILDEPTNGLDPNGIIEIRELLQKLNLEQGKTILVSSHLLAEIEKLATHVGIIHQGRLRFQGTLPELQAMRLGNTFIEAQVSDTEIAVGVLQVYQPVINQGLLQIPYTDEKQIGEISNLLYLNKITIHRIGVAQHDLEELFMQIIADS